MDLFLLCINLNMFYAYYLNRQFKTNKTIREMGEVVSYAYRNNNKSHLAYITS